MTKSKNKISKGFSININISDRMFYTLVAVGILILLSMGVYAYNSAPTVPSTFGHSLGEIDFGTGIISSQIKDGEVKSVDIGYMEVKTDNILSNAITSGKIAYKTINSDDIVDGAVGGNAIYDGSVGRAELSNNLLSRNGFVIANLYSSITGESYGGGWAGWECLDNEVMTGIQHLSGGTIKIQCSRIT